MKISIEFVLNDFWIGAYWKRQHSVQHIWICLFPCFPIHVQWKPKVREQSEEVVDYWN